MSAHVVVIDSTARRAVVKTTPGTYLSDVLQQGASKLGYKPDQFGLKHNNKPVDLSRTIRLSGLSSGAKLELVQASRSVGVVSVALQLPPNEVQEGSNPRLTDKFPSNTTLWLILRKFEAGVAGATSARNLTARGVPATNAGSTGAGRLYYEQPVLNIMGRELSSFTDLQKTLAQLGFNSGSTLIRLTYRASERPLEEAMAQIQEYFTTDEQPAASVPEKPAPKAQPEWDEDEGTRETPPVQEPPQPQTETIDATMMDDTPPQPSTSSESPMVNDRPISVYRPPTATTPSAATTSHNDSDYVPTVEHAQIHQKLLQQESQNKRLLTDAQLEAQAKEQQDKLAQIRDVEIKIRFPDQSAIASKFTQADTAAQLYGFVKSCMDETLAKEPFVLRNPGVKGKGEVIEDGKRRLIMDLQLKGRVLVVFSWMDPTNTKAVLKPELQRQAQEYQVPEVPGVVQDESGVPVNVSSSKPATDSGEGEKKKIPKWLSGLKKKK